MFVWKADESSKDCHGLDNECAIPLLKQLSMNAVWLNTAKCSKVIILLTNKHQQNPGDNIWYKKSPLGKN